MSMKNRSVIESAPDSAITTRSRLNKLKATIAASLALSGASLSLPGPSATAASPNNSAEIHGQANARLDALYIQMQNRIVEAAKANKAGSDFDVSGGVIEQLITSASTQEGTIKGQRLQMDSIVSRTRVTPTEGYNLSVTDYTKASLNKAGIKTGRQSVLPYSSIEVSLYQSETEINEFQPQLDLTPGNTTPLFSEYLYKDANGNWDVRITSRTLGHEQGAVGTYTTSSNGAVGPPGKAGTKVPTTNINSLSVVNKLTERSEELLSLALENYPIIGASSNLGSPHPVSHANLVKPVEE
jgi:hypothetical protein